jgi:hypothetical protein
MGVWMPGLLSAYERASEQGPPSRPDRTSLSTDPSRPRDCRIVPSKQASAGPQPLLPSASTKAAVSFTAGEPCALDQQRPSARLGRAHGRAYPRCPAADHNHVVLLSIGHLRQVYCDLPTGTQPRG